MILTPKNWKSFQHYKDRSPAWIKLHKALLDDYEFSRLPVASRALAPMLWLLASEYDDGKITASLDKLAFRLHMTSGELADALSPLVDGGFFCASDTLAECKQDATLEKRDIEQNINKTEIEATASAAPPDPAIPEREYFVRGREVLGNKSGAMIANLLKAKGRNVALARAALEEASQKQSPIEFVAAICRGPPQGKPLTEHQRAQQETRDILNELDDFARGGSKGCKADIRLLPDHTGERSQGIRGGIGQDIGGISRSGGRASG